MGKRQIGELQPSELVLAIMISDLATLPMQSTANPLISGIIPIVVLTITEIIMSYISQKSVRFRKILSGSPSLIISGGRININEMNRLRFNIDDLFEELRTSGYTTVGDIEYAVLETNGQLSVVPKAAVRPLTPSDVGITPPPSLIHRNVIKDGILNKHNLSDIGRDEGWVKKELEKNKIKKISDVFIMTADSGGDVFIQTYSDSPDKNYD
jgi:uncharacterized membrane protein YcaP (DUF421 family)